MSGQEPYRSGQDEDKVQSIIEKINDYINSESREQINISLDNLSQDKLNKILKWLDDQGPGLKFFGGSYIYIFVFMRKGQLRDVVILPLKSMIVLLNDGFATEPLFLKFMQEYYKIENVSGIFEEAVEHLKSITSSNS